MKKIALLFLFLELNSCMAHTSIGPCRDPSTGRFISCSTSTPRDNSAIYGLIGTLAGLAVVSGIGAGISYYVQSNTRNSNTSVPSVLSDRDNDGVPDSRDSCPNVHRGAAPESGYVLGWEWGCPVSNNNADSGTSN